MDIDKFIKKYLREGSPTNNTGSSGAVAGLSAASTGAVTGISPRLIQSQDDFVTQDYQTPYGLNYRLSNIFPVAKLSEKDVDDMVDASREYEQVVDEQRFGRRDDMKDKLQRIIDTVRGLKEEMGAAAAGVPTNNASSGNIAGLPPDTPPVRRKKKYIYGGRGSRKMWMPNKKNG
tara:strand:+ start:183 stop:707 length:525 start_codon:yes stop_codon:yes gene_type:complete